MTQRLPKTARTASLVARKCKRRSTGVVLRMSQLLVINPNTTQEITDKVADAVRALAPAGLTMVARSGAFGPRYIASRATFAVAGHAALDAFANHGAEADAVLLACFGDPGLDALREVSAVPVIGLIEAAVEAALARGKSYSIVTGGELWRDMLRESLTLRGLTEVSRRSRPWLRPAAKSQPTPRARSTCLRKPARALRRKTEPTPSFSAAQAL